MAGKMRIMPVPKPISAGVFLSYKCTSECKHCMHACSPRWRSDWISETDLEKILSQLADKILASPLGSNCVDLNYGLHFTGGEPFLNPDLLLKAVGIARQFRIPSTFVETNCFWCMDDETTRSLLVQLKETGLRGILISVNPFTIEYVSPERIGRAIRISREVFGKNTMVYQELVYRQLRMLGISDVLPFEEYLKRTDRQSLFSMELLPLGRAPYKLGQLFKKYGANRFFGESCGGELRRNWHVHIDNYGNYVPGYCGGISLGDAHDLNSVLEGVDLDDKPVIDALVTNLEALYELGKSLGYRELEEGYVSMCHLCIDLRRWTVEKTDEFRELSPKEFHRYLE